MPLAARLKDPKPKKPKADKRKVASKKQQKQEEEEDDDGAKSSTETLNEEMAIDGDNKENQLDNDKDTKMQG